MKPIYILLLIAAFPFLCSCKQKKEERLIVITTTNSTRPIDELKKLALKGDTQAYEELQIGLMGEYNKEFSKLINNKNVHEKLDVELIMDKYNIEDLMYSIVMANKYKYPRAYYHVYSCLTLFFEDHEVSIDEKTKSLAIEYLKKGVELNDAQSMYELGNLYLKGKYVSKDTILGKRLKKEWNTLFNN